MSNLNLDPPPLKRIADRYIKGPTLGEGTYGIVFKAFDTKTKQTVAIKRIRLGKHKEGGNFTALREIKLLKELKDPNIIELIDAFPHKGNLLLVFEFMESDLEAVILDRNIVLSPADIKSYLQMTLRGLAYCHRKWVLHRDVKPNNLLIGADGQLKLADFGLARLFGSPDRKLTHQVFARWYRAPELLFGAKQYGSAVDVWASACIFAELLLRRPFLQGSSDIDQLGKIFSMFGTPMPAQWPDMVYLPDYVEYQSIPASSLLSVFPMASEDALDLLLRMFCYNPETRISVQQALNHRYFSSVPAPTRPMSLPRPPSKGHSLKNDMRSLDFNPRDGSLALALPRQGRNVMLSPDGPEGNSHQIMKAGKHISGVNAGHTCETRGKNTLLKVDFAAAFGSTSLCKPNLNRMQAIDPLSSYSCALLGNLQGSNVKRKLNLDLESEHPQ